METKNALCAFFKLPPRLLAETLRFLGNGRDILNVTKRVCRGWTQIPEHLLELLWKETTRHELPWFKEIPTTSWETTFRNERLLENNWLNGVYNRTHYRFTQDTSVRVIFQKRLLKLTLFLFVCRLSSTARQNWLFRNIHK